MMARLPPRPTSPWPTLRVRLLSAAFTASAALALYASCTTQEPLGLAGALCTDDGQCASPLACRCLRILSGGEDGSDRIARNGFCASPSAQCPTDGGVEFEAGTRGDATAESNTAAVDETGDPGDAATVGSEVDADRTDAVADRVDASGE